MAHRILADLSNEGKKHVEHELENIIEHFPLAAKYKMLAFMDKASYALSPKKLRACVDILELLEVLAEEGDTKQRLIDATYDIEKVLEERGKEVDSLKSIVVNMFKIRKEAEDN